ncbi:MAG: type IV secretory system conjugative DNA transfer family protein [Candidatus Pacebacteria bacterium]|nr:type IV secretory system conjugative DNA transfer family protein [Candidatus Paceibacterota bacterium]MBP9867237.1 type IV secretory system conjugative DNA transfer family protein [Candidatus Paceibacterota bacterium]
MNNNQFSTPEEEISYLRAQVAEKLEKSKGFENRFTEKDRAHEAVREYKEIPIEKIITTTSHISAGEKHRLLEWLSPKETDDQVRMLFQVMAEKGLKNAFVMAEELNSPEVEDDFERFVVQYIISGHEVKNNVSKDEWKALHMKLFEIILPEAPEGQVKQTKEMMGLMEQWYASMQALASDATNKEKNYYSLELGVSNGSTTVIFYCAVHIDYAPLFEKVVLGVFPTAKVHESKDDYNIFSNHSIVACSYASHSTHPVLPIKTYANMEADPMSLILSSFTKIAKDYEGLALQILVRPAGDVFAKRFGEMLEDLRKGETLKRVIDKQSVLKESFHLLGQIFSSPKTAEEIEKEKAKKISLVDENATKLIQEKLSKTIIETNIRIVSAAPTLARTQAIRADLESSFAQFAEVNGNSIKWEEVEGKKQKALLHRYSYRLWNEDESYPLNLSELASLFHFPMQSKDVNNVRMATYTQIPAPSDLCSDGIILGMNQNRGIDTDIHFGRDDRMRHMYVIGQTGTGKTVFLKNMIIQDIKNGDGCCFIDPHGTDIVDILANIPAERAKDVIYFDPAYMPRPMGLNMLEYDRDRPETKTFVVNELLGIFNKLFDMKATGGPGFEQYFRNATLLVMEHPESGNTLLDISRVFSDKDYRDYKLSKCKNPLIVQFWQNAEKTTGDQGLQNWVQYVNSKFDVFMSNDIMRPIVAQEKSAFNFRDIMDSKKIFLVNLAKGRLGDINSSLLGLIIVGKFSQAALSRVDTLGKPMSDFYLYIDEFQNVTTPAIASILSEARKYRLSLTVAHQYIGQLEEDIKGAIFGNVGSMAVHRVSPDDAKYLESKFAPTVMASDIMKMANLHAYVSMLANNEPKKPFDISVPFPPRGDIAKIDALKELSYITYGRPVDEVNAEIMRKYNL